jgi:hypothetical protein
MSRSFYKFGDTIYYTEDGRIMLCASGLAEVFEWADSWPFSLRLSLWTEPGESRIPVEFIVTNGTLRVHIAGRYDGMLSKSAGLLENTKFTGALHSCGDFDKGTLYLSAEEV